MWTCQGRLSVLGVTLALCLVLPAATQQQLEGGDKRGANWMHTPGHGDDIDKERQILPRRPVAAPSLAAVAGAKEEGDELPDPYERRLELGDGIFELLMGNNANYLRTVMPQDALL